MIKNRKEYEYVEGNGILLFLKGPLSQWYGFNTQNSYFHYNGKMFNCCEQWMMAEKSLLFNDYITYNKIMLTPSPSEQKSLGRVVESFDQKIWDENKYRIVLYGNLLKFSQNFELKQFLLDTGDLELAEANPKDSVWGIALSAKDSRSLIKSEWRGENLLGKALMEVRSILKGE